MDTRQNNFDFLRLLFALFVIITHSYPLSGLEECDWLCRWSNGQLSFSYVGVRGFFVISGFLIFQSLQRSKNIVDYFQKRILRLFPALFVLLLITIILVPFVYQNKLALFENQSYLSYLPRNLFLYKIQHSIDGVFETNPFKSAINGSLWTIRYEFSLYVMLTVFIFLKTRKNTTRYALAVLYLLLMITDIVFADELKQVNFVLNAQLFVELSCYFVAGSLMASLEIQRINRKKMLLALFTLATIASISVEFFFCFKYIGLPLIFLLFSYISIPMIANIGKKMGDLSYGIYLYSFPVQQTLMYYFNLNAAWLTLYAVLITVVLAFLSWHLVEKKALKLKNKAPYGA